MRAVLIASPVYNIRVQDDHTYAVSDAGILVHNKSAQINQIPSAPKVTATFSVGEQAFFDVNPTARELRVSGPTIPGLRGPNIDTMDMHAEIGAMFQAYQSGVRGGTATLIVQGEPLCLRCTGDVKTLARAMDLDHLTIVDESGMYHFNSDDLRTIKLGGKGFSK